MKNYINYYYGLNVDCVIKDAKKYIVESCGNKYVFKICNNVNSIRLYQSVVEMGVDLGLYFRIIPNKYGNFVSYINNQPYVLSKISISDDRIIRIDDINSKQDLSELLVSNMNAVCWTDMWAKKIDCLEDWLYEKNERYNKYAAIFNYCIGISENALQYLKNIELSSSMKNNIKPALQHYRVSYNGSLYDYYDFTNVLIDNRCRDIGEYIKSCFLRDSCDYNMILDYLNSNRYSVDELQILYSRLLFPTFFYDYVDDAFLKGENVDLVFLGCYIENYELHLVEFSKLLFDKYRIQIPEWLLKKV